MSNLSKNNYCFIITFLYELIAYGNRTIKIFSGIIWGYRNLNNYLLLTQKDDQSLHSIDVNIKPIISFIQGP